ncbi:acyltransferase family protein [Erythrobacter donghaensis]|uniref:acyltransferase family protein n=1 Tax=Erythrobacter donghaensis TaxID=267135 RepID=UPI000A3AE828|nr:acyltransferase [Erythrobacter donghaensis]
MPYDTLRTAYERLGNRGPGFDMLRLVAASAVVVHHAMKIEHDIVRDDWLFRFSGGYTQLGLLAVSVFFALSGFLITPGLVKSGNVIGYLSRRFMRIMPLLAAVVVGTALVVGPWFSALPVAEYYSSPVTWRYLKTVTTFLSLQLPGVVDYDGGDTINGPIWTLHFEWACYLLLAGLAWVGVMRQRWLFLALYVAALAALWFGLGPIAADGVRGKPFMFLFLFAYFGAGVLIQLFSNVVPWSRTLMLAALALLVAAWATPFDYLIAPLLTTYLVVGIGLLRFPETPLTTGVDLSYGVYLMHSVVLMMLMNLYPFTSWLALFAVCWPITLALAYASWRWIEEPALGHKEWPERIARGVLARLRPRAEAGA